MARGTEKAAQYDQAIAALEAEIRSRKAKVEECARLVRFFFFCLVYLYLPLLNNSTPP